MRAHLLLLLSLAASAAGAAAQVTNPTLLRAGDASAPETWASRTYEQVQASVVWVAVEVDGPRGAFVFERASSGVVVDASGLIVTFAHLVREAIGAADKQLLVQLNDAANTKLKGTIVEIDDARDLALVRVTPPADGLHAALLGPAAPHFGEPVLIVARPSGEDMLAFAGVASRSLAPITLRGTQRGVDEVFLCDARNDERCDGAPVFGADGVLLGLYASEHVLQDVNEPTLEDLKRPSFGAVLSVEQVRKAFEGQLGGADSRLERPVHGWAAAVARVAPSVVCVAGSDDAPRASADDPGMAVRRPSVGSGVVLSRSGLVATNAHLCEASPYVFVEGRALPAEVLRRHGPSNLALLQVELPAGMQLQPAPCAADGDALLGETVLALGNPTGGGVVVTQGVVSAFREREGGRIQSDANLGNANGGGAIVDATGAVVGIGDAGRIDPIDMAWMMRGDRAQQESNLSTFVGIEQVRKVFVRELERVDAADAPIRTPVARSDADQQARQSALTGMVERVKGAMLNIYIARNVAEADPDDPFPPDPVWRPVSMGSGVIIDPTGLAVSNWHVVDDATESDGSSVENHRVTAHVFSGRSYEVQVLSISREDDLSLLQLVLEPGETVPFVELGNSDRLAIGEAVAAIGNPHGRANTITYGVTSAKGDAIKIKGRWAELEHLIETDAAINGGNSGGALLDMAGRLVGINSAGGGTFNNKGYAIAVDHVRRQVTGLLLQPKKLRSATFGMRMIDAEPGRLVVMDVDARGPAARAGIASGERLVSLAGADIAWSVDYARTLLSLEPGVEVDLVLEKDGTQRTVQVAPVSHHAWTVVKQSSLQLRDFTYAEAPERVRNAAIAVLRGFTGNDRAEPTRIPSQLVQVERAFRLGEDEQPVEPGDLLVGVELPGGPGGRPTLEPIDSVEGLAALFNDMWRGKIEGVDHYKVPAEYPVWIERDGEAHRVTITAVRLLW